MVDFIISHRDAKQTCLLIRQKTLFLGLKNCCNSGESVFKADSKLNSSTVFPERQCESI